MAANSEEFWQQLKKVEETGGPAAALVFVIFFAIIYLGLGFFIAWLISITFGFGTSYWMIVAILYLLKLFL